MQDKRRLQALLDIRDGNLQAAAEVMIDLARTRPYDAGILNDLGVVYLALGNQNAPEYLKAIQSFERARQLNPTALAPRFNLVLAYRSIGLDELAGTEQIAYERHERDSAWIRNLQPPAELHDARLIEDLQEAVANRDAAQAGALFRAHIEAYRRIATASALNPLDAKMSSPILRFVANYLNTEYKDATLAAMLAPLDGSFRDRIAKSRQLANAGIADYFQNKYDDSVQRYDQAEHELTGLPQGFDNLWIELNRANSEIRQGCSACSQTAEARLDHVLAISNDKHWRWMRGQALTSRGSDSAFARDYGQLVHTLVDAVQELTEIGARSDTARPVNYLASLYYIANDFEGSFQFIHQALLLTQKNDHVRQTQLFVLAGKTTFRLGCVACAIGFERQAVAEARQTDTAQRAASTLTALATLYAQIGKQDLGRQYLIEIRNSMASIPPSRDKDTIDMPLNLLCSRIEVEANNFRRAERCLQDNLRVFREKPDADPLYYTPSLLELARIYVLSGRVDQARETFRQAMDVIEKNDAYFAIPGLRSSFENERRSLYDAAIGFEADHGGMDAAWTYLQHYRSKLFLEFLGQMNPKINEIHGDAVQRDQVQKLIPKDVQVVEYVMLPDRLLMWLISGDTFTSRSIAVTRAELQATVGEFLDGVRNQGDVKLQSEKLYRLLIAPIADKLDPRRALAIIPDQDLHRLPFPSLRNAPARRYLIEDYAILESPNLTQLLFAQGTPSRTSAVAFASITDDVSASVELAALKTFYPADKTFIGNAVNKKEFLRAMTGAGIFHYSGHSVDASDPLRSSLLLDGDREGPNSITALDVSQQHMRPNSLVVLASCDSSVGNSRDGVGMRGLTSAFLIGGAGSVVGSLWLVETISTSRLVTDFHKGFAGGISAAQALRNSQIGFIKSGGRSGHPYYWSGFVVTGNVSALR